MIRSAPIKVALVLGTMASSVVALATTAEGAGASYRREFVWQKATQQDRLCVPSASRDQGSFHHDYAATPVDEANQDYSPDTRTGGFVRRDASDGDRVCVRPEIRARSAQEDALGASRVCVASIPSVGLAGPEVVREQVDAGPVDVGTVDVPLVVVAATPVVATEASCR